MVALDRCSVRRRSSSCWKVPRSKASAIAPGADAFRYVASVDSEAAWKGTSLIP